MGKLIGPITETYLDNAMLQGVYVPPQSDTIDTNIGLSWTFKIIGDWEKADGKESYHCTANRYVFRPSLKKYELDEKIEYHLYSPSDLDEKPTQYAVGDEVRAIFNGLWEIVGAGGGGSTLYAVVMEPVRCPLDRLAGPNPFGTDKDGQPISGDWHPVFKKETDNLEWNNEITIKNSTTFDAAMSMGTIKISGKTYEPIKAVWFGGEEVLDENDDPVMEPNPDFDPESPPGDDNPEERPKRRKRGEPKQNEEGNQLYLQLREPMVTTDNHVRRQGDDCSHPIRFRYGKEDNDGNDDFFLPFLLKGVPARKFADGVAVVDWPTTTDPKQAQLNYDPALCRFLDWSETLVEGESVGFEKRTAKIKVPKMNEYGELVFKKNDEEEENEEEETEEIDVEEITFEYYEVLPPSTYSTQLVGSGEVQLESVKITRAEEFPTGALSPNDTYERTVVTDLNEEIDEQCERVFLKLQENHARIKLSNAVGICNDCRQPRLRGSWYKKDKNGRKYAVACEVDYLPFGYAIETAKINCYYHTNTDDCNPVWNRPWYTVGREAAWHLRLLPSNCAIPCTNLTPTQGTTPPDGGGEGGGGEGGE